MPMSSKSSDSPVHFLYLYISLSYIINWFYLPYWNHHVYSSPLTTKEMGTFWLLSPITFLMEVFTHSLEFLSNLSANIGRLMMSEKPQRQEINFYGDIKEE